jgi:hypothetical protein
MKDARPPRYRYVRELEPNQTTNFTGGNIPPIYSLLLKSFKRQSTIQLRGLQMFRA